MFHTVIGIFSYQVQEVKSQVCCSVHAVLSVFSVDQAQVEVQPDHCHETLTSGQNNKTIVNLYLPILYDLSLMQSARNY